MKASESESESEPALKVRKLSEKTTATRGYLIFHLFILPYFLKHLNIRQRLECRKHKNIINNFFHFHFHFDWSQLRPLHWLASSVCIWASEAAQGNSWTLFQFHFFSAAALVIAPPPPSPSPFQVQRLDLCIFIFICSKLIVEFLPFPFKAPHCHPGSGIPVAATHSPANEWRAHAN